ncbi:MAG: PHP domain-containing protein [Spartobacteria bacterium]|nr:PHP domain-containing protein [Spartobacteria bacterium]
MSPISLITKRAGRNPTPCWTRRISRGWAVGATWMNGGKSTDRRARMKIDLHVHARERSACSVSSEHDLIKTAIDAGLDGLCFTDHHTFVDEALLADLNRRYAPFRIYAGIEITTLEEEDILVYGVRAARLEERNWRYADLHALARERNGALVLAHPYRYRARLNIDVEALPPDAVESRSINIQPENYGRIQALCDRLGVPPVCNSDAHSVENISGRCTVFDDAPADAPALAACIRARAFHCMPGPSAPL